MDWKTYLIRLEIQAGVGAIMATIKNPNSELALLLKDSLITLAESIFVAFGRTPPPDPMP